MPLDPTIIGFIAELVRERAAIVLKKEKFYIIESKLQRFASENNITDLRKFYDDLKRFPLLQDRLIDYMTINETSFFREARQFDLLKAQVFPDLVTRRRTEKRLRIWSAACSSGQEPYSLAITVAETRALDGFEVAVLASDLSERMLKVARAGQYNQLEINRGLSPSAVKKYFICEQDKWTVKPHLRQTVQFRRINLLHDVRGLPKFDVIWLRNVLIYFDVEVKKQVVGNLIKVLRPDGYFFVSTTENLFGISDHLELVREWGASVYRLKSAAQR